MRPLSRRRRLFTAGLLLVVCITARGRATAADISGNWTARVTMGGTAPCQWVGSLTTTQTDMTFSGTGSFILVGGVGDPSCAPTVEGTYSGTLSGSTITFGLYTDQLGTTVTFGGTISPDGQAMAGRWSTSTASGSWWAQKTPPPSGVDITGTWAVASTLPGHCQWIASTSATQTDTTFTGGATFLLVTGGGDPMCAPVVQGTYSGNVSGSAITFGLFTGPGSATVTFSGAVSADGQSMTGTWSSETDSGTWSAQRQNALCPQPQPPTCTEEDPCVSLRQGDICPEGAAVDVDSASVESVQTSFCPGDAVGVIRVHQGTFVETVSDQDFQCHEECTQQCGQRCIDVPISSCWQVCIRRCSNGVCLEWETQCGITGVQTECTTACFNQCFANFEPVTKTNFFIAPCGFAIDDLVETRTSDGACTGAVQTSLALVGSGTVAANATLPLVPGAYDVCENGTLLRTVTVDPCVQPACAIRVPQNVWSLHEGLDAALPVMLAANDAAGGTYSLSLWRFEDDAHTTSLPLPPFIVAPPEVTLAAGTSAGFDLVSVNPHPVGTQVQWPGLIIRAEGPASCEATVNVEMTCSNDADCQDDNPCTIEQCAPTDRAADLYGCVLAPASDGTPCTGGTCQAGVCVNALPVNVNLGSAAGRPGGVACVTGALVANGHQVAGTANDIAFDGASLTVADSNIGPAIGAGTAADKQVFATPIGVGVERVGVVGFNTVPIPDGFLFQLTFGIQAGAAPGSYTLGNVAAASDPAGSDLPATGAPGQIVVTTCTADCNGDGQVSIGEVIKAINLFLGRPLCDIGDPARNCPAADENLDGSISIGEVVQAVNRFLEGCA